jgi:hypothetical protein
MTVALAKLLRARNEDASWNFIFEKLTFNFFVFESEDRWNDVGNPVLDAFYNEKQLFLPEDLGWNEGKIIWIEKDFNCLFTVCWTKTDERRRMKFNNGNLGQKWAIFVTYMRHIDLWPNASGGQCDTSVIA